jgi:hypothetical protein
MVLCPEFEIPFNAAEGDVSMADGILGGFIEDVSDLSLRIDMSLDSPQGKTVVPAYMHILTIIFGRWR